MRELPATSCPLRLMPDFAEAGATASAEMSKEKARKLMHARFFMIFTSNFQTPTSSATLDVLTQ